MSERPSRVWKTLAPETRLAAATAFWADRDEASEVAQLEARVALAQRLKFREKSIRAMPSDRRSKYLAQLNEVSDLLASRLLVAYHFAQERPLMSAFLDAIGIQHDNGLITEDEVAPPEAEKVKEAVAKVRETFPEASVSLYLRTLKALDGDTWAALDIELTPE